MTRSLRVRLLAWVIGGMAVLQVGFAAVVYEELERSLRHGFNAVLATEARTLSATVEQDARGIRADVDERDMPEFRRAKRPDYFEMWSDTGEVVARSTSLRGADLARPDTAGTEPAFRNVRLPDGRAGRAAVLAFSPRVDEEAAATPPRRVTLVVARGTSSLDEELAVVIGLLSAGAGGTILVSLLLAALIVRHGLRPLDSLAAEIAAVRHDDLSARIPTERLPTELAPVVQRLNDLLRRLEEAFTRERAFTADMAHELRTPLAGLRATIEVALARPRGGDEYRDALSDSLAIVVHAQGLADRLLTLAQMEGGQVQVAPEPVELAPVVAAACGRLADETAGRRITVSVDVPPGLACTADRGLLVSALSELAANAAEYTGAGGRVDVRAGTSDGRVQLSFSNPGCTLDPGDAARVFDRFWRGDPSRTRTGVHCGLGLTLVRRSIEAMGGSVHADISSGVFAVQLSLPLSPGGLPS